MVTKENFISSILVIKKSYLCFNKVPSNAEETVCLLLSLGFLRIQESTFFSFLSKLRKVNWNILLEL